MANVYHGKVLHRPCDNFDYNKFTISSADAVEQSEENDEKSEKKTTTFLTPDGSE